MAALKIALALAVHFRTVFGARDLPTVASHRFASPLVIDASGAASPKCSRRCFCVALAAAMVLGFTSAAASRWATYASMKPPSDAVRRFSVSPCFASLATSLSLASANHRVVSGGGWALARCASMRFSTWRPMVAAARFDNLPKLIDRRSPERSSYWQDHCPPFRW
ncbi:MAG: hypothetical protein AAFV43_14190 [Planctomycetota bacterium]